MLIFAMLRFVLQPTGNQQVVEAAEAEAPVNGAARKGIIDKMQIPHHRYQTSRRRLCLHLERREAQRMRRP